MHEQDKRLHAFCHVAHEALPAAGAVQGTKINVDQVSRSDCHCVWHIKTGIRTVRDASAGQEILDLFYRKGAFSAKVSRTTTSPSWEFFSECPMKTIVLVEFIMFCCKRRVRTLVATEVILMSVVLPTCPLHITRPDSMEPWIHTYPCFRRAWRVM